MSCIIDRVDGDGVCALYKVPCIEGACANWQTSMTNAARIRAMTDRELGDFLHEAGVSEPVWDKEFSRTFCNNCQICDWAVGHIDCPYGRPVDWWLGQEANDGKAD